MKLLTADPESYRAATRQAKTDRKRLWKNFEGTVFDQSSPFSKERNVARDPIILLYS